jgi:hypothetical protein
MINAMSLENGLSGPVQIVDQEKVALGKNGFLFQKFDQAFEQLCGDRELRDDQVARWVTLIEARHAWLAARNVPYIFAITPEKHAAYPDCLPEGFSLNPKRLAIKIVQSLSPDVKSSCVYYDHVLREGRSARETFYRTDIHWTKYGACLAYNEIANRSGGRLPQCDIAALSISERKFTGEFVFYLKDRVSEVASSLNYIPPRKSIKVFSRVSFKEGQLEVYETPDAPKGTLVFFRDSNGTAMLPFLLPHFSRAIIVASNRVFYDVLRSEDCSLVITQMAERYLGRVNDAGTITNFPDDFAAQGFEETTGIQIPLPRTQNDLAIDLRLGGNADSFLGEGWSGAEETHRWATGDQFCLRLPPEALFNASTIEFTLVPLIDRRSHAEQRASIFLNDVLQCAKSLSGSETIVLPVSAQLRGKPVTLKVVTPDAVAPKDISDSSDGRKLSFNVDLVFVRQLRNGKP